MRGKTQGDKKLNTPAKNDKKYKLIVFLKFYPTHHCYKAHEHSHSLQYGYHLQTFGELFWLLMFLQTFPQIFLD